MYFCVTFECYFVCSLILFHVVQKADMSDDVDGRSASNCSTVSIPKSDSSESDDSDE